MDGIKIEEKIAEIKDQSDTVSMEGDEFRTAEEYDSFLDSFRISSQRSSQGVL